MQDRPTAIELTETIREFLKTEILPNVEDPRIRFRTLVAMNALSILEREVALGEILLESEHIRLAHLLGRKMEVPASREALVEQVTSLNWDLAGVIRSGRTPPETLRCLKEIIAEKLAVASPRYLERYDDET